MAINSKIALDTMCFIYFLEKVNPYFSPLQKLFSQAQAGQLEITTSIITFIETLSPAKLQSNIEYTKELTQFFKEAEFIKVYGVDWETAELAASFRRQYPKLRTPDSIHLATTIITETPTLITNDDYLSKLTIHNLQILTPKSLNSLIA